MSAVLSDGVHTVLLIGDDDQKLEMSRTTLIDAGIASVIALSDSRVSIPCLEKNIISLVVIEMNPAIYDTGLLTRITESYPQIPVIVVTESSDVETAVECMKAGAVDCLCMPLQSGRLISAVESAICIKHQQQEALSLKEYLLSDRLEHAEAFNEIRTCSRKMRSVFQYTEVVSCSPQALLITGETGVGKELFARAIHRLSRVKGMFVSINVAGLDDAMFSDTLFGHKKGAFTGADQYRDGLVSKAANGTLFLDEIGDLNELSQVKLLRLLQEHEYYPVGADLVKKSTARIVLATNIDLPERIREGRFRKDLYYRLCSHQIRIPSLRERREDIPLLLEAFIEEAAKHFSRSVPSVDPELLNALMEYEFPGNVRELQAKVNDSVARHEEGVLTLADFPGISPAIKQNYEHHADQKNSSGGIYALFGRLPTFREIEDYLITEALKVSEGNYAVAATMLGVTRQTISKRLKTINKSPAVI